MLSPVTGEGASPRIGRSDGGVDRSRGLGFEGDLPRDPCGASAGSALALLLESGAGAFFGNLSGETVCFSAGAVFSGGAGLSGADACFCLSSASSDWIRFSIASIFFIRASLTASSAAHAPPLLAIVNAVAASSVLRREL